MVLGGSVFEGGCAELTDLANGAVPAKAWRSDVHAECIGEMGALRSEDGGWVEHSITVCGRCHRTASFVRSEAVSIQTHS